MKGSRILGEATGLVGNEKIDVQEVLLAHDRVIVDVQGVADEEDISVHEVIEGEEAMPGVGDGRRRWISVFRNITGWCCIIPGGLNLNPLQNISTCVSS